MHVGIDLAHHVAVAVAEELGDGGMICPVLEHPLGEPVTHVVRREARAVFPASLMICFLRSRSFC
jgi:hypothetical protein